MAQSSPQKKSLNALSFEELAILNERKEAIKKDHFNYVESHPELKTLMSSFMSAILIEKPDDVLTFAIEHFSTFKPAKKELEPLVIAGPSGVGKGTLINMLLKKYPNIFGFSVSHTTRSPREGEVEGVSYYFTSKEKMQQEIEQGLFLEHANVHGNFYGTSKIAVKKVQEQEKICILDIDIQGVQQVKASGIQGKYLFISPPSMEELEQRLRGRATETEEKIQLRVKNAANEIRIGNQPGMFDINIVNTNLEETFQKVIATLRRWFPDVKFE